MPELAHFLSLWLLLFAALYLVFVALHEALAAWRRRRRQRRLQAHLARRLA